MAKNYSHNYWDGYMFYRCHEFAPNLYDWKDKIMQPTRKYYTIILNQVVISRSICDSGTESLLFYLINSVLCRSYPQLEWYITVLYFACRVMTLGACTDLLSRLDKEQSRPYEGWAAVNQTVAEPILEEEDWDDEVADLWEAEPPFFVNFQSLWCYDFLWFHPICDDKLTIV